MTSQAFQFDPFTIARAQRSLFERARRVRAVRLLGKLGGVIHAAARGIAEGIRLLRTAPPLGDVGTRGNDLTSWIEDWNQRGNPSDSSRE